MTFILFIDPQIQWLTWVKDEALFLEQSDRTRGIDKGQFLKVNC